MYVCKDSAAPAHAPTFSGAIAIGVVSLSVDRVKIPKCEYAYNLDISI